jgi:hypothetical protein
MKIYKEKQFLVFDFEDGKTVKYDFATKTCIGKKGKPVNNLCSQLSGLTIDQLCSYCTDKQYGKFLRFVQRQGDYYGRGISNIGTILDRVPRFSKFEQIFSAGIDDIVDSSFSYGINDIPKGLIKLCRLHDIKLSNNFLKFYKEKPDEYFLAYNLEYISLEDKDIYDILNSRNEFYNRNTYRWEYYSRFIKLLDEYGYTAKGLLNYLDYCKTFEAMDNIDYLLREIEDYAKMMKEISPKFDKYPRHFLTTHKIACRNYNRLKEQFEEDKFKRVINLDMERTFGEYRFIYPKSIQEIKDESVQMNNCVSSYIKKVIDGQCHILFLRYKDSLDKSLVTIEVRNNKIVQALQKYNNPLTKEQKEIVDKWDKWWANKINNNNNNESEELENVI